MLIMRLSENGLMQHIEDLGTFMFELMNDEGHRSASGRVTRSSCEVDKEELDLEIADFGSLMFIWMGYVMGMALAGIIFIGECVVFKLNYRLKSNQK